VQLDRQVQAHGHGADGSPVEHQLLPVLLGLLLAPARAAGLPVDHVQRPIGVGNQVHLGQQVGDLWVEHDLQFLFDSQDRALGAGQWRAQKRRDDPISAGMDAVCILPLVEPNGDRIPARFLTLLFPSVVIGRQQGLWREPLAFGRRLLRADVQSSLAVRSAGVRKVARTEGFAEQSRDLLVRGREAKTGRRRS